MKVIRVFFIVNVFSTNNYAYIYLSKILRESLIMIENSPAIRTTHLNYLFRKRYIKQKREIKYRLQRFEFMHYLLPHFISFHFAYSDHFLAEYFL